MTLRPLQETVYRPSQPLLGNLQLSFAAEMGEEVLLPKEADEWSGAAHPSLSDKFVLSWPVHSTATLPGLIEKFSLVGRVGKRERILSLPAPTHKPPHPDPHFPLMYIYLPA